MVPPSHLAKGRDPFDKVKEPDASDAVRKQKYPQSTGLEPKIAFYIFFAATLFAAFFSPIQDCDEVFNYWEPSHYLNHGYGLQTWEYSPVYAIRSWAYAGIHSIIIAAGRLLPFVRNKPAEFYLLRSVLAFVCALCETRLFAVTLRNLSPRLAIIVMVIMATSTGMFHASTSYLPSTFAMYTTMLGAAAFIDWRAGQHTAQGIMWFGIGATLGWPFAGVLILPFLAEEGLTALMTGSIPETLHRFLNGTVRSLIVLAVQVAADVFFYKKLVCVPWNIVAYNVFGGSNGGPNIYGTEPWHFYIRNLALNFNFWFMLALLAHPTLFLQQYVWQQAATGRSFLHNLIVTSPFYLWLAIFTVQPHKEERFMYPAYPLLTLNAAFTFHILLTWLGSHEPGTLPSKLPPKLKMLSALLFLLATTAVSQLRTVGMITAYSAPLKIYAPLLQSGKALSGDIVCLGKEWYRFPSSYFLPDNVKAKFIRSEFTGLLPGEFREANVGFGLFPGTWLEPAGMNDENREDPGKYTDISHCAYLVDSDFASTPATELEPKYIEDTDIWETAACEPFLDATRTGLLGRILWLPELPQIPDKYRRHWGRYCLLRRRKSI